MLILEKVNSFYAFEPQKNIFLELNEKFSKNKKVSLFNFAMDNEITNKKLYCINGRSKLLSTCRCHRLAIAAQSARPRASRRGGRRRPRGPKQGRPACRRPFRFIILSGPTIFC